MSLVITRKESESFTIFFDDKEVQVSISQIRSSQVKVAIDAPDEIDIWRDELLDE